jgi:hypothetical protein
MRNRFQKLFLQNLKIKVALYINKYFKLTRKNKYGKKMDVGQNKFMDQNETPENSNK